MGGFFSAKEIQSNIRPDGKAYSCVSCGLYKKGCETPKMKAYGGYRKKILNIFEQPTDKDDRVGNLLSGNEYSFVASTFAKHGISIKKDCLNTSALKCAPPEGYNKKDLNYSLACCKILLMRLIKQHKPDLIFLFGKNALTSIIASRVPDGTSKIETWRGFVIPDQELKCFVAPVYGLYQLKDADKNIKVLFDQDIQRALKSLKKKFPVYVPPKIVFLRKSLKALTKIKQGRVAIDYETTGLKPHKKGHKILVTSIAVSPKKVYVFKVPKKESLRKKFLKPYIRILKNPSIEKMAHNMKFEDNWSFVILGVRIRNWFFDSMLAAHLLDNRAGITRLKVQAYIVFGVVDYSSEVTPYLKAKNPNDFNKLEKYMKYASNEEKVMIYCAMDSALEYELAETQTKIMKI